MATENDVRDERASSYLDGAELATAHMVDALANGKTVNEAMAYTKAMTEAAAQHTRHNSSRTARQTTRETIRAEHGIGVFGASPNMWAGRKLA